ncbi:MAG TPA: sigma-70 family RNA polymerase sigma factor [Pyrinomonadaceae bacterium]
MLSTIISAALFDVRISTALVTIAKVESELMTVLQQNSGENLTGLLLDWRRGDEQALEKLTVLVYDEIRRMAHRFMQRERNGHTLQTTALVNEAYVRLIARQGQEKIDWSSRSHFFAVVAQVMRHVLIDHARRRKYQKRAGEVQKVSLDEATLMSQERASELLALDEALTTMAQMDPRKSKVIELRYFGGLSLVETAEALELSVMTVRRDWRAAKAWLFRELRDQRRVDER